jgi:hypothetical protein
VTLRCRAAAPFRVHARIVDDRIHAADCVDLVCKAPGLGRAAKVAEDDPCRTGRELAYGRRAIPRSGMQRHFMAVIEKRLRRSAAEPVRTAGDEDERHFILLGMKFRDVTCRNDRAFL